jgi:choline dehydrogenase-like flavoprotein
MSPQSSSPGSDPAPPAAGVNPGQPAPGAEEHEKGAKPEPDEEYWAVIIGSGFGGAVTACRLAQALQKDGRLSERILLLERGRRYYREDFPRLQLPDYLTIDPERVTSKRIPEIARMFWSHDQGLWDFRNLGELRVAQAAGLGGGSLVYCNVHLRPPPDVFLEGWPDSCEPGCKCDFKPFSRDGLKGYYDRVAEMLEVAALPKQQRGQYPKVRAMEEVAAALRPDGSKKGADGAQAKVLYPPLAVRFKETAPKLNNGNNRFNRPQGDCTGCGNCTIGCQEGAKNTLDLNYLAVAQDLGVEIRTLCDVRHLEDVDGQMRIPYVDYLRAGTERAVRSQYVFLCAGAVGSTELLLRSRKHQQTTRNKRHAAKDQARGPGDANKPGVFEVPELEPKPDQKPRNGKEKRKQDPLGRGFYANGDNLAVVFDSRKPISATMGPTITSSILHVGKAENEPKHWFLLQDGGVPPTLVESLGFFRSPMWLGRNRYRAPGMVPGRSFLSQLTGSAAPVGTVDRLMDEVNTRVARALGDPEGVSRERLRPTAALTRALRLMVPAALKPLVERAESVEKLGRQELRRINSRVITLIDQRLLNRVWTIPFAPLRSVFATQESLVDLVAQALSEQYPVLRHLFIKGRGVDLALGLLRMLVLGGDRPSENSGVFLLMGPDQKGSLYLRGDYTRVNWNNLDNAPLYTEQERLLRDAATALGGELRTNPAWTVGRTPLTVHAQGGCAMATNKDDGVVRPSGQHWRAERVYVMDAAAFPRSVGVNPAATIAAVAERNIEHFIRMKLGVDSGDYLSRGIGKTHDEKASKKLAEYHATLDETSLPNKLLPAPVVGIPRSPPVGMHWEEEMVGYLAPVNRSHELGYLTSKDFKPAVVDVRPFLAAERRGAVDGLHVRAKLQVEIKDLGKFFLSRRPKMDLKGTITVVGRPNQKRRIAPFRFDKGALYFDLEKDPRRDTSRFWANRRRLKGMTYDIPFTLRTKRQQAGTAHGRKFIHDDPGIDVWADLSTLYVGCHIDGQTYIGVLRISLTKFLQEQVRNMSVQTGKDGEPLFDEVAQGWAFLRLAGFFLGAVKNAYSEWL